MPQSWGTDGDAGDVSVTAGPDDSVLCCGGGVSSLRMASAAAGQQDRAAQRAYCATCAPQGLPVGTLQALREL